MIFFSFITFRSCKQLDGKHTIFGKLVGGIDTLNAMEQIEVDNKDRPIHDIVIEVAQVFVDPFAEAEEQVSENVYLFFKMLCDVLLYDYCCLAQDNSINYI